LNPDSKPLLQALRGTVTAPPPIWLMRQAGRYLPEYRAVRARVGSFLELCYSPELACEVTLQPVRRFALDAAIVFSDILVVPHALGQSVAFVEGEGPRLDAITDADGLARLANTLDRSCLAPVYEAIARSRAALPRDVALIGFAGGAWTVACYMVEGGASRDFARIKGWAYGDPASFARLIDVLSEAIGEHLIAQIAAGAEAVQIFDSWAGVLAEREFERWCVAPTAAIVRRVRAVHPDVPIIGFPRGCGQRLAEYAAATAVDAVSADATVPARALRDEVQARCAVQGNLDPVLLLTGGDTMAAEARRLVATLGDGPFVFNLGHGVLPATPPDNVAQLVAAVRRR
jgi:uroporphyrinogen decarboxylase